MAGLDDELTALDQAVQGIFQSVPAAVVQESFAEVMTQGVEPDVRGMFSGSNAALRGASEALSHYEAGDLAMAATAMRSAAWVVPSRGHREPVNPDE